jgi:hypothetical protein
LLDPLRLEAEIQIVVAHDYTRSSLGYSQHPAEAQPCSPSTPRRNTMRRFHLLIVASSSLVMACAPNEGSEDAQRTRDSEVALAARDPILRVKDRVPDQYIVVLKGDPMQGCGGNVRARADVLARRHSGSRRHVYESALCGFSVRMPEASARRMADDPEVSYVEEDGRVSLGGTQYSPPWGLDRIDQRNLPLNWTFTYPSAPQTVHVYVLDTGIRTTHSQFGGRAFGAFTAISDGYGTDDRNGHGTHVAATIGGSTYGVAKSSRLFSVRVLGADGSGTFEGVIAGVDWVSQYRTLPAVANMSLGGGGNQSLDAAVTNSINAGITYVVSAGNNAGDACLRSPARVGPAITVGATDSGDARAWFSNFGTCLDVFAPGVDVQSAYHTSDTASQTLSGTSMAAPHVAGGAALHLASNPAATPSQVAQALITRATSGKVTNPGSGSPNRLLYVGPICPAGAACDDGDACTVNDVCDSHDTCRGTPLACAAPDECSSAYCFAGSCYTDGGCGPYYECSQGVCMPASCTDPWGACP